MKSIEELNKFLDEYIPRETQHKFPGNVGLMRTKQLLNELGNPQNKLKVIHVAGTSGKGSTASCIPKLLEAHGFTIGLHISPFLEDLKEQFQINSQWINDSELFEYMDEIIPAIEKVSSMEYGKPTYFEIIVTLAYYIFYSKKVDYAVIEVGLGGTFDATNVVEDKDKICVITPIGLDHMEILGNTVEEIAAQKAGIIRENNVAVTNNSEENILSIIKNACNENEAILNIIEKPKAILKDQSYIFDFEYKDLEIKELVLNTAKYQVENCSLAIAAIYEASKKYNWGINEKLIKETISKYQFPGRMEIHHINDKLLILDGAHNPQKMEAFINSLKEVYVKKFTFLVAFKKGKDIENILNYIIPVAEEIIITSYFSTRHGLNIQSEGPEVIVNILKDKGFTNYKIIQDANDAIKYELGKKDLIITGSLYLLSEIYSKVKSY